MLKVDTLFQLFRPNNNNYVIQTDTCTDRMSVTTEKAQGFQDPKSYGENEDQLPYVDRVRVGNGTGVPSIISVLFVDCSTMSKPTRPLLRSPAHHFFGASISSAVGCPSFATLVHAHLCNLLVQSKVLQHPLNQLLDLGISIRIFVRHSLS